MSIYRLDSSNHFHCINGCNFILRIMKSKQVLSIEQMKHLQELGLDASDASMCWHDECYPNISGDMKYNYGRCYLKLGNLIGCFPTYTLQDIIQKLPPSINICMLHIYPAADLWYFVYMDSYTRTILSTKYSPDIMNAAYQMLCWVIENGHLETNK